MITNLYFNNYQASNEQTLLEDLIIESIKIYGMDCFYIARTMTNYDKLQNADDQSIYRDSWLIEVYPKNVFGFGGDREFMSKFAGLEIRDQIVFLMSMRRWRDDIGDELGASRPREGDLLFFPMPSNQKCFQIKYVDQLETFYQLGNIYTWQMTCEVFEYSHEKFQTGIPEIDILEQKFSLDILNYTLRDPYDNKALTFANGDYWVVDGYNIEVIDPLADNETVQTNSNKWVDWSTADPFSEEGQPNKEV